MRHTPDDIAEVRACLHGYPPYMKVEVRGLTTFIRAAQDPLLKAALVGEGSLSNCNQSQTEALPASVRGVTSVAYSFRSNSSGNLAKFTANRRASSCVSRFGRRAVRRSNMSGIGGEAEARGLRLKRR